MPREHRRIRDLNRDDDQYIILVQDIPRHCRWQELKDMTRSLGGEQSLKAEVFAASDGSQLGHCTIKGRSAATQVYENFCVQGWNGKCVRVSLAVLEKPGILKTIEGPRKSRGATVETRVSPSFGHHPHPAAQPQAGGLNAGSHQPGSSSRQQVYPSSYQFNAIAQNSHQYYHQRQAGTAGITVTPSTQSHASVTGASRGLVVPHGVQVGQIPYTCPTRISPSYPAVSAAAVAAMAPYSSPSLLVDAAQRQPRQLLSSSNTASKSSSNLSSVTATSSTRNKKSPNTVLISRLPPQQSEKELRSLLEKYGSLVYLDIGPKTLNTEKAKGTAKARYDCAIEAVAAVQGLNGSSLGGSKIKVRQEKPDKTFSSSRPGSGRLPAMSLQEMTMLQQQQQQQQQSMTAALHSPSTRIGASYYATQSKAKSDDTGSVGSSSSTSGPLIVDGARCLCTSRDGKKSFGVVRRGSVEKQDDDGHDDDDDDSSSDEDSGDEDDVTRTSDGLGGMKL